MNHIISIFATSTIILSNSYMTIDIKSRSNYHCKLNDDTARVKALEKRLQKDGICKQMPLSQRWYKNKQKNISANQKRAISELWPSFGVTLRYAEKINPVELFLNHSTNNTVGAYCVLDIGFGAGDSIVDQAQKFLGNVYVGCEIHKASIGATLLKVKEKNITNVKLIRADVRMLLESHLVDACFDEICVFFPDPWPRNDRDVERRVIRPNILKMFSRVLKVGGHLRIATDVDEYAAHVIETVEKVNNSYRGSGAGMLWELRDVKELEHLTGKRPTTRYERKGIEAGRTIQDFTFRLSAISLEI